MQRIVTYTRLHGNGDELVLNGIIKAEFERQRERERKYMNNLETKNYKLLKEKMDALRAMVRPPVNKSFADKAKDVYTFVMACIICFLMWAGWLVYDPPVKEVEAK